MSDLTTLAGQTAHYAGIKARLRGAARKPIRLAWREPVRDFLLVSSAVIEMGPNTGFIRMQPWRVILQEVAKKHGLSVHVVTGHQRSVPVVTARHEAMYRMAHETKMSLPMIAKRVGVSDHSSVYHGIRRHAERFGLPVAYTRDELYGSGEWRVPVGSA